MEILRRLWRASVVMVFFTKKVGSSIAFSTSKASRIAPMALDLFWQPASIRRSSLRKFASEIFVDSFSALGSVIWSLWKKALICSVVSTTGSFFDSAFFLAGFLATFFFLGCITYFFNLNTDRLAVDDVMVADLLEFRFQFWSGHIVQ